jgi:hypothetical protein
MYLKTMDLDVYRSVNTKTGVVWEFFSSLLFSLIYKKNDASCLLRAF